MEFKSMSSAGKVMLTLYWDFNGPILKYQDSGQTVSSKWYCTMLEEDLKPHYLE